MRECPSPWCTIEGVTTADGEDPARFIEIGRYDWLVTGRWKFLHAVRDEDWSAENKADMAAWGVWTPARMACGRTAKGLFIPGPFSRGGFGGGLPRCKGCCRALGGPEGNGSPKNSDEWRKILGLPA
jgi:hypothetical protein